MNRTSLSVESLTQRNSLHGMNAARVGTRQVLGVYGLVFMYLWCCAAVFVAFAAATGASSWDRSKTFRQKIGGMKMNKKINQMNRYSNNLKTRRKIESDMFF